MTLTPDSNMGLIHDPELPNDRRIFQHPDQLLSQPFDRRNRPGPWSQHNDPSMIFGWIAANVREIEVERDQHTPFCLTDASNHRVHFPGHLLLNNRHRVISMLTKQFGNLRRQVFVRLEFHAGIPGSATYRSCDNSEA